MPLRDWSNTDNRDGGRARRLAGAYVAATAVVAGFLVVGVVFGGQIKKQLVEEETEVKFVPKAEAPPPPPPPPPPPAVKKVAILDRPPLGAKASSGPPTEIPKGPPEEGDPNAAKAAIPFGEGDPNGCVGCTGKGSAPPAPPAPPPPPPAPVMQVAEVSTAPVPLEKKMPAYPEDARKQGVEAVVVVKFVVTENGEVDAPKVVKGHPMFDELVLAAVRSWTFKPATLDGAPVRMARLVKIPFRLKAQNQ